ncbi:MAG: glycine cleavage system protein H [Planctomycetales bacterium]
MSDELVFLMGKFEARFPTDRSYAENHMWAATEDGGLRLGFSAYAVRLLQDVYFLEWFVDPGETVPQGHNIGFIESSKAESDLFAPTAGTITAFNEELLADPSAINVDKYGKGWLFAMEQDKNSNLLLSPEEYMEHLASSWEKAQRTIKGQIN